MNLRRRLRDAAAPDRYPERLWKKALLTELKRLVCEDLPELKQCVRRGKEDEAAILLGIVLAGLFRLGFLACRRYYPWRSHLRWAFDRLPEPVSGLGARFDALLSARDWRVKLAVIESLIGQYKAYIGENGILPELRLKSPELGEELTWAERLRAWEKPGWRAWVERCTQKAIENGYPAYQFWVWSLWGRVSD